MKLDSREVPHVVVGAMMEVHRQLGAGFPVEAYRACLAQEFRFREIFFKRDAECRIDYKGVEVPVAWTMDFVVEGMVVLNCYCVDELTVAHAERLKNQLRMTGFETGFLVNFQASDLRKGGVRRLIVSSEAPEVRWRAYGMEEAEEGSAPPASG
ncbi:MAG TPA: GxxExxY protein [Verrucomicrobiales bacterium]|nr:GxxExxY protein [Verrucomicrobiales bacterium]